MIPTVPEATLHHAQPRSDRLIALFLLGMVLFTPALLHVFGHSATVFGWPVLFVYVFVCWVVLVLLTALDVEGRSEDKPKKDKGPAAP